MIVCSCNVISDTEIKESLQDDTRPRTPAAVYRCLGCSPNCGRCFVTVRSIISEALGEPGHKSCVACVSKADAFA